MQSEYGHLTFELIIFVLALIGAIIGSYYEKERVTVKGGIIFICVGLSTLILSVTLRFHTIDKWNWDVFLSFIQLKEVGGWFFRGMAFTGYFLIVTGVTHIALKKTLFNEGDLRS